MEAIKTIYNGIKFRSKLEARWAVFFDAYGLQYEYEPETFKLKSGLIYSPDFYFPELNCYAEIKPLLKSQKDGYYKLTYDDNVIYITGKEYNKIIEFELKIVLIVGMPLERNWLLFNDSVYIGCVYPCRDWKNENGNIIDYFRWWSCCQITDYPSHRDIEEPANIARYYDFFNF